MALQNVTLPGSGVEAAISAYLHRKSAAEGVPLSGTFELTRRCNFNCRMCYIHSGANAAAKKEELPAGSWLDIASQAVDAGMLFLLLTGGEPLMREDFAEIYEGLCKMGLCISVNTNGSLLRGRIAELFERKPPNRINVSLYGAIADTYCALCGVDQFETVKENIERMRAAGIEVRLNVSITPDNVHDLAGIADFASAHNLWIKATSYMYPPVRGSGLFGENEARLGPEAAGVCRAQIDRLTLRGEEFQRRLAAIAAGTALPADDACIDPSVEGSESRCRAGRAGFWIDFNGGMRMCGMTPVCADLKQTDFRQAWEAVRRDAQAIRLPAACSACELRHLCPVCAAACYTETGTYGKKPAYLCRMTAAYAEEMQRMHKLTETSSGVDRKQTSV